MTQQGMVQVEIGDVVLEVDADEQVLASLGKVVREAFDQLAERIAASPVGRFTNASELAIEQLDVSVLSVDELLGARGAERLGEELYRQLLEAAS